MDSVLLAYYCVAIIAASVVGGVVPRRLRLTHTQTELIVSFVAGTMLGIALLHLAPHALATATDATGMTAILRWTLGGFLAMFFIERFFCFHHHDVEDAEEDADGHGPGCGHNHSHSEHAPVFSWGGAAMGLTLHSLLAGVALAASVRHAPEGASLAGLGVFLAIVLHKPLDAMTIAVLMRRGGWSLAAQCAANGLFALAVPLGVVLFNAGVAPLEGAGVPSGVAAGLAFSAGVFLCVSMSDLLPELQFHDHDRIKLSIALVLGLAVADVASRMETHSHGGNAHAVELEPTDLAPPN